MADDIPKRSHTKRVYQSSKDVVVETPPKKKLKITRTNHAIDGTLGIGGYRYAIVILKPCGEAAGFWRF